MTAQEDRKMQALWCFLDHVLEASALICDFDAELAGLAMVTALAAGDQLRLPDKVMQRMQESALAEVRRQRSAAIVPLPPRCDADTSRRVIPLRRRPDMVDRAKRARHRPRPGGAPDPQSRQG